MGNGLDGFYNNEMYLGHFDIDKAQLSVEDVQQKSAQMFVSFSGVTAVIPTSSLMKGTYSSGVMKQAQNSYFPSRSGDLLIVLEYGWRFKGANQKSMCDCNSGFNENTHVPLIFYGWKIPQQDIYRYISMDNLAVTLSFLLDISLPNKSTGEPIVEILK